ncbi:uncharacterized protein LOC114853920 isoform X2 [Betta splendens]|uniref:Uncharacterized protein LOC114853920 isoform X2 n=1 Tax=Betta splendens TaxID=158456 RepID=A0A6P7MBQ0_BETSP|nr:uncharacterized protein LOC114853920 isoform X2 [Betta splendens]
MAISTKTQRLQSKLAQIYSGGMPPPSTAARLYQLSDSPQLLTVVRRAQRSTNGHPSQRSAISPYQWSEKAPGDMDRTRWMLVVLVILVDVSQQTSVVDMYKGDSVLLPCEFPTFEMTNPTVVWSRSDLSPSIIHQRQQDGDELKDQNQLYRGRTLMLTEALESGDLSLNLTALTLSDRGTYTCSVTSARGKKKVKDVQLQVKETFPSWATILLLVLATVLLLSGGLFFHFRHYFQSVVHVQVEPEETSVLLPCKTLVRLPEEVKVKWKRNNNIVHQLQCDGLEEQYCLYSGRTNLNRNHPRDWSLTLKFPADEDSGTYICTAYIEESNILFKKQVELKVKVHQVEVEEGQKSVQLPFTTAITVDQESIYEVEWTRYEPETMKVHTTANQPEVQHEQFKNRTEMQKDALTTGNFSLTLNQPTVKDGGRYVCGVWKKKGQQRFLLRNKTVYLTVNPQTEEVP